MSPFMMEGSTSSSSLELDRLKIPPALFPHAAGDQVVRKARLSADGTNVAIVKNRSGRWGVVWAKDFDPHADWCHCEFSWFDSEADAAAEFERRVGK